MKNEMNTPLADLAVKVDEMFVWHLIGALSAQAPDWLESTAERYLVAYHADKLAKNEANEEFIKEGNPR